MPQISPHKGLCRDHAARYTGSFLGTRQVYLHTPTSTPCFLGAYPHTQEATHTTQHVYLGNTQAYTIDCRHTTRAYRQHNTYIYTYQLYSRIRLKTLSKRKYPKRPFLRSFSILGRVQKRHFRGSQPRLRGSKRQIFRPFDSCFRRPSDTQFKGV